MLQIDKIIITLVNMPGTVSRRTSLHSNYVFLNQQNNQKPTNANVLTTKYPSEITDKAVILVNIAKQKYHNI